MIEKFMEGENLGDILKKPTENEADPAILDPDINEAKLNIIYEQVAGFPVNYFITIPPFARSSDYFIART
jgi:hypothetical protein